MWFEISLFYILFVGTAWSQENNLVQCSPPDPGVPSILPADVILISQTPNPIGSNWEAYIVVLYTTFVRSRLGFNFDVPAEVSIEIDGTRTQLPYQVQRTNTIYHTPYNYEDLSNKNIDIYKIFVRNVVSTDTPHLIRYNNQLGVNDCDRIRVIPFEKIHLYKIATQPNSNYTYTLSTDLENDSRAKDLVSFIKDRYSTTIASLHATSQDNNSASSSCGKRKKTHVNLITSGYSTSPGDWPWHAAVYYKKGSSLDYKCGGTLVNKNAILTAAHCVFEGSNRLIPQRLIIRLGAYSKLRVDTNTQEYDVYQIFAHENFVSSTSKNDIAILHLATEPRLNDFVQPVCLWPTDKASIRESEGKDGYVIGWGKNEKQEDVEFLSEAKMPVVSYEDCLERHSDFYSQFLNTNTFCAGFRNGTSVCNGDSGGGMFFKDDNGIFRIRGIVSLSMAMDNSACDPNEYVIFTNVGRYLDWIENTIATHL